MRYRVSNIEGVEYQIFKEDELSVKDCIELLDYIGCEVDEDYSLDDLEQDEEVLMTLRSMVRSSSEEFGKQGIVIEEA